MRQAAVERFGRTAAGVPTYKTLIAVGELAPGLIVTGRLLPVGTIELIDVGIDFEMRAAQTFWRTRSSGGPAADPRLGVTPFMTRNRDDLWCQSRSAGDGGVGIAAGRGHRRRIPVFFSATGRRVRILPGAPATCSSCQSRSLDSMASPGL